MMFGSKVRYCVTYKTNQRSFDIFRRKFIHDFKVPISSENLEGSIALELKSMNAYLVSKIDKVIVYDSSTFKEVIIIGLSASSLASLSAITKLLISATPAN